MYNFDENNNSADDYHKHIKVLAFYLRKISDQIAGYLFNVRQTKLVMKIIFSQGTTQITRDKKGEDDLSFRTCAHTQL